VIGKALKLLAKVEENTDYGKESKR
jgi:hypothetical protein